MNQIINFFLEWLNNVGQWFWDYSAGMFVQSSVLIVLLLIVDFMLRKRVRAVFRYCVWMLVFVKLILPPALSLPTGIGYWYGDYLSADSPVLQQVSSVVRPEPVMVPTPENFAPSTEVSQIQPSRTNPETVASVTSAVSGLNALTWQAVVFGLWLVGVLVISVLLVRRMLFVKGLIAQSEPAKNRLPDILNQCRRQVGIGRNIELRLSNSISSPAVCGLFKQVILIPTALLEKLSPDKLRAVLIHELVHIKRADIWVNLVQTVLQIIYFYNPFVWLANAVVRRVREQAVDEMVLVALGAGAKSYSNTLIDIAEMAFWKTSLSLRLIGVVESKKALHRRIRHMLNRPIPKNAKIGVFGLLAVMVMAAVLLPMAASAKDDKEQRSRFIAELPDGVMVELVGVCEHPSEGKQWWRPDGNTIEADGFRDYDFDDAVIPEKNECARLLALKLDDSVLQDVQISWALKDSRESRFAPDYADRKRTRRRPIQVILAAFPKATESTNLRLAVAAGPWDTVAAGTNGQTTAQARDTIAQRAIIYTEASEENGRTHISATHLVDANYDCRIYARGKDGEVYEPRKHSNSGSEMRLCRSEFDIPLQKIEWFHLQARPFQWVTFKNISLQPGIRTDVQVESERGTKEAVENKWDVGGAFIKAVDNKGTLPNGVTVELVGICEHPSQGKQWWRLDGTTIEDDLRPYASKELRSLSLPSNQQENKILELAVKITDSSNRNVGMICSGANRTFVNCRNNVWGGTVEIDKELDVNDFKIGVAVGAWETLTSSASKFGGRRRKIPGIVFTEAYNTQKGYAVVIVTHKKDIRKENWRVVAIDKEGKPHKADLYQTQGIGEFEQNMFHFKGLRSDQIRRFEFQTRPYQWIIFKNVSLKPGIKTDVQVDGENGRQKSKDSLSVVARLPRGSSGGQAPAKTEGQKSKTYVADADSKFSATLPNGIKVELVGVCEHPSEGKQWWKPDGVMLKEAPYDKIQEPHSRHLPSGIPADNQGYEVALNIVTPTETPPRIGWRMESRGEMYYMEKVLKNGRSAPQLRAFLFVVSSKDKTIEIKFHINNSWIRFKNVSLQPGVKTDVQVEGEKVGSKLENRIESLISVLRDFRVGKDKEKWFAAVRELVEVGSTAVPALASELRQTQRPQTQSVLAFTLRAIGDPRAVPALIDALAESGFSSDYGVGKADTELAKFIKKHQVDPLSKGVRLCRPVREITIALERLTSHGEGHEHFDAYDDKGNRLGSFIVTPEIRDRQRAHRREVAQRWHKWRQQKQEAQKLERGILAAPEGAMLTLAIVPNMDRSGRQPSLTKEEYQGYIGDLAQNGPFQGSIRGDSFQWSPIKGDVERFKGLPLSVYKEQTYVLLCARAQYVMFPEIEGKLIWGLEKVEPTQNANGRPGISIQFDEKGAELFYELTRVNVGNHLAIGVDGWVLSAPRIETPLRKKAIIAGDLTTEQVRSFVEDLRKGMPPVKTDVQVEAKNRKETLAIKKNKVYLPDLETPDANVVLDFATGQMLSADKMENDQHYFDKSGKGDLAYEYASGQSGLLCLRGARMQMRTADGLSSLKPDVQRSNFIVYVIRKVPCQYQITTAEGNKYELKVLSVDKGDKGGAHIEHWKSGK